MPRFAIVAIVLVVAGLGVFFWSHRESEGTSPTVIGTPPTSSTPPAQKSGADTQSTQAADSRVTSASTAAATPGSPLDLLSLTSCHLLLLTKQNVEQSGCDKVEPGNKAALDQCQAQLADVNLRLQALTAGAAPCPESLAEPSVYYQALRSRAQSGDAVAQRCFISGYFGQSPEEGKALTQAEQEEYVSLARTFIDSAFERGDWSVVRWLGRIRLSTNDGLLGRAYPIGQTNPETIYKMKYLLVLGKQIDPIEGVDPKDIVDGWRKDKTLTPEQFQKTETWARQMYAQHFDGSQEQAKAGVMDFCPTG